MRKTERKRDIAHLKKCGDLCDRSHQQLNVLGAALRVTVGLDRSVVCVLHDPEAEDVSEGSVRFLEGELGGCGCAIRVCGCRVCVCVCVFV